MSGTDPFADARTLRFGVSIGWMTRGEELPVEATRPTEASGSGIGTAADQMGAASPFVVPAAAVTDRVRLRTYVLDYGFWRAGCTRTPSGPALARVIEVVPS